MRRRSAKVLADPVDFARGNRPAYRATIRYGWFDEICSHMMRARTPSRLITKELCAKEALKHSSRGAFQKDSKKFYIAARRHGWLDGLLPHGTPAESKR